MTKLITLDIDRIKQVDGLYCLNDLHKASGGADKHRPAYFMARAETKALVSAIEQNYDDGIPSSLSQKANNGNPSSVKPVAVKVIKGNFAAGSKQGTYACRELVYAYAMWISADFYLSVIRVFDVFNTGTLSQQINALANAKDNATQVLSYAGWTLSVIGKQVKPAIVRRLKELLEQQQPKLDFGGNHD